MRTRNKGRQDDEVYQVALQTVRGLSPKHRARLLTELQLEPFRVDLPDLPSATLPDLVPFTLADLPQVDLAGLPQFEPASCPFCGKPKRPANRRRPK